jgi:hypothetical protein
MNFQVSKWPMKIDQLKISYTARGVVLKVQIARWESELERDCLKLSRAHK